MTALEGPTCSLASGANTAGDVLSGLAILSLLFSVYGLQSSLHKSYSTWIHQFFILHLIAIVTYRKKKKCLDDLLEQSPEIIGKDFTDTSRSAVSPWTSQPFGLEDGGLRLVHFRYRLVPCGWGSRFMQ